MVSIAWGKYGLIGLKGLFLRPGLVCVIRVCPVHILAWRPIETGRVPVKKKRTEILRMSEEPG